MPTKIRAIEQKENALHTFLITLAFVLLDALALVKHKMKAIYTDCQA